MLNYATTHLEYKIMSTAMVLVATGTQSYIINRGQQGQCYYIIIFIIAFKFLMELIAFIRKLLRKMSPVQ